MRLHTLIGAAVLAAMAQPLFSVPSPAAAPVPGAVGPAGPIGGYLAGLIAQSNEDWVAAARYTADALALSPDDPVLRSRAFAFALASGDYARATETATRARRDGDRSPLILTYLATDALARGDAEETRRLADEIGSEGLGRVLAPLVKAWGLAASRDADGAVRALAPLGEIEGLTGLRDFHAGLILDQLGDGDQADARYRAALGETPALQTVMVVAEFWKRRGHADDARRLVDDFNARRPDAAVVDAQVLDRRPLADPRRGLAEALYDIGGALRREGTGEVSIPLVRAALAAAPDLAPARMLAGEILSDSERHEEALAEFRALESDPVFGWAARLRSADSLIELKREDEAIKMLTALIDERPDRSAAAVRLGDLQRTRKAWREAAAAYSRVLDRIEDPREHHWAIFYSRAISEDNAKDWPKAEADLRSALHLSPDNPNVLNYLGYSLIDRGLNLEEGRRMVERAVALRPDDGYIVDSLGWALFKLGDFPGAVEKLEGAVERMALDPTINDHLGDAYFKVGRRDEARFQWERALKNADGDTDTDKIRAKLTNGGL